MAVHDYDLATFYSRPDEPSWPVAGGRVWREPNGILIVRLHAEEKLEWTYLSQHLEGDPVLIAVEECKVAIAADISARKAILGAVVRRIEGPQESGGLGWPMIIETGPTFLRIAREQGPASSLYYAFRLYDQVLSRSLRLSHHGYDRKDFMPIGEDRVDLGSNPVICASEEADREDAIALFLRAQQEWTSLSEVQSSAEAYRNAEKATAVVGAHLDRLRLAVAFPPGSACDGCR